MQDILGTGRETNIDGYTLVVLAGRPLGTWHSAGCQASAVIPIQTCDG